jgi:exonuclease III
MSNQIDVMALTESWLYGDDRDKRTIADIRNMLPDHELYHKPRKSKTVGGGVCVIIKKGFQVTVHAPKTFKTFDHLDMTITSGPSAFRLFTLYRPQYSRRNKLTTSMFLEDLSSLVEAIILTPGASVLVGDFNIHVNKSEDPETKALIELLDNAGLKQLIDFPTHRSLNTLDLIITNADADVVSQTQPDHSLWSDHVAIKATLDVVRPPASKKTLCFRRLANIDLDKFRCDIMSSSICTSPNETLLIC